MRLKLDENLPLRVERFLKDSNHDCSTVVDEGLGGATDPRVAAAAAGERRMIVTLDRGFGDARAYPPGGHPGIVVIRPVDQTPDTLLDLLQAFLSAHDLASFEGCVVVVESARVRVRRPPG